MSEPLIVSTYFGDVAELTEGFADRVEEGQIILYGPNGYEEGDRIGFQVLLADGSAALEGTASVIQCVDAGEERDPEFRFDVVLAGLDLVGAAEAIFERLLAWKRGEVSTSMPLEEEEVAAPVSEAVELDAVSDVIEEEPAPARISTPDPAPSRISVAPVAASEPIVGGGKNAGMAAGARGLPPPSPPPAPAGFTVALGLAGQLGRPVMAAAWTPEPPPREPSMESTGQFEYGPAVPIPTAPPRPEIDPARQVAPAPAPTSEEAYRAAREALGFAMPTALDMASGSYAAPEADVADVAADEAFDVGEETFDVESGEG